MSFEWIDRTFPDMRLPAAACPACGRKGTLVLTEGELRCFAENAAIGNCPRPSAAQEILANDPTGTGHIVTIGPTMWTATHPLFERLGDGIPRCRIAESIEWMRAHGFQVGTYMVTIEDGAVRAVAL